MTEAMADELLATDLADYLVRRGVPFRTSHEVIGRLVRLAEERGVALSELDAAAFKAQHEAFEDDVRAVFDWQASVDSRDSDGGTSLRSVSEQLDEAASRIADFEQD
jgi:argininosuccinate lyase